jgi:hypothetical protein
VAEEKEKPEQPKSAAAPQKEDGQDLLKVLRERLGVERSTKDVLKENLRDLEKQLTTITRQNAKLETQSRDTVNIKAVNAEILRNQQNLYVTKEKIAAQEKEIAKQGPGKVQELQKEIKAQEELSQAKMAQQKKVDAAAKTLKRKDPIWGSLVI